MFKNIIKYILNNIFKIKTETTDKELNDNSKYAREYASIKEINFNAIFSNKLANYVINDSNLNITGDNARVDLLNKTGQAMWKKAKKIVSMGFGYGGVIVVPYVKGGKIYYSLVPQDRLTIDNIEGELITGATVLAERKVIKGTISEKVYLRWTNYKVENGNITITQQYSDEDGNKIPTPDFWKDIQEVRTITNVDRVLFGYIKSPINNRRANDKYGVPITYGCDETINEIKETMAQMLREYELKETFVGADVTMFKNGELPKNGLFKKIDSGDDTFFEVFDPQYRDYTIRLQELFKRLEHQIGTSAGIVSEMQTQNATATEIKRAMYDTFTIVDDMRSNLEKAMDDFFYACNVLANAYNLTPQGEYEVGFDWSYSLLEDSNEEFNHLLIGYNNDVIKKEELRQWIKPDETLEESKKAIQEIEDEQPDVKDILSEENK